MLVTQGCANPAGAGLHDGSPLGFKAGRALRLEVRVAFDGG